MVAAKDCGHRRHALDEPALVMPEIWLVALPAAERRSNPRSAVPFRVHELHPRPDPSPAKSEGLVKTAARRM